MAWEYSFSCYILHPQNEAIRASGENSAKNEQNLEAEDGEFGEGFRENWDEKGAITQPTPNPNHSHKRFISLSSNKTDWCQNPPRVAGS